MFLLLHQNIRRQHQLYVHYKGVMIEAVKTVTGSHLTLIQANMAEITPVVNTVRIVKKKIAMSK